MHNQKREIKVKVGGNNVLLEVENLVVFKAVDQISKAVRQFTTKALSVQAENIKATQESEARLIEIEKQQEVIRSKIDQSPDDADPEFVAKLFSEYKALQSSRTLLITEINLIPALNLLDTATPYFKELLRDLLQVMCPSSQVTLEIVEALSIDNYMEIWEAFATVNRLADIPKKPMAQEMIKKAQAWITSIFSGQV